VESCAAYVPAGRYRLSDLGGHVSGAGQGGRGQERCGLFSTRTGKRINPAILYTMAESG